MKKIFALFIMIFISLPVFASDWVMVSEKRVLIDRDSIKDMSTKEKTIKRFLVREEYYPPSKISITEKISEYVEMEFKINCTDQEVDLVSDFIYFTDGTKNGFDHGRKKKQHFKSDDKFLNQICSGKAPIVSDRPLW